MCLITKYLVILSLPKYPKKIGIWLSDCHFIKFFWKILKYFLDFKTKKNFFCTWEHSDPRNQNVNKISSKFLFKEILILKCLILTLKGLFSFMLFTFFVEFLVLFYQDLCEHSFSSKFFIYPIGFLKLNFFWSFWIKNFPCMILFFILESTLLSILWTSRNASIHKKRAHPNGWAIYDEP